jgi:hypothetical protein
MARARMHLLKLEKEKMSAEERVKDGAVSCIY